MKCDRCGKEFKELNKVSDGTPMKLEMWCILCIRKLGSGEPVYMVSKNDQVVQK